MVLKKQTGYLIVASLYQSLLTFIQMFLDKFLSVFYNNIFCDHLYVFSHVFLYWKDVSLNEILFVILKIFLW